MHLILLTTLISLPFLMSCGKSIQSIDHPTLPRHSLHIDGDVQFQAEIQWEDSSQSLKTHIRAINATINTTTIETGPCAFQVLAYDSSGSDRELIWHNQVPQDWICTDELYIFTLKPMEEKKLTGFSYISGNSWKHEIPEGEWEFEVRAKTRQDELILIPGNSVLIQ